MHRRGDEARCMAMPRGRYSFGLMKAWYTTDSTVCKCPAALNTGSESSIVWKESSRSDSILAEGAWDR